MRLLLLGMLLWVGGPWAASAAPLLQGRTHRTEVEEAATRKAVFGFHRLLVGQDDPRQAAATWLATDFRDHDPDVASGAASFAATGGGREQVAVDTLFSITDGDFGLLAYPVAGDDPGRLFTANLFEVRNGRITQIWYSGQPAIDPGGRHPALPQVPDAMMPDDGTPGATIDGLRVIVPSGTAPRPAQQAEKALVEGFFAAFFGRDDDTAAAVIAPDVVSHVAGVASGKGFALVARKHPDRVTVPDPDQPLFVLAEGDLVAVGFPVPYAGDPGAGFAQNVVRVRDGKIVEWWYSGYPSAHARRRI